MTLARLAVAMMALGLTWLAFQHAMGFDGVDLGAVAGMAGAMLCAVAQAHERMSRQ